MSEKAHALEAWNESELLEIDRLKTGEHLIFLNGEHDGLGATVLRDENDRGAHYGSARPDRA